MPNDTTSPFTPGVPVPVEFFFGRLNEIKRLREKAAKAATGALQVAFMVGERGIGKSSLATFVRVLAERDPGLLGVHTFLGGVGSLEEMVRRVFDRLLKESVEKAWFDRVKEFLGNRVREVGLFGISVEFGAAEQDLTRLVHDFAPALRRLAKQLEGQKKGIFLILDDINGLASSLEFANWLKSLVDEIATSQAPMPLLLLLVGLEERRQALIRSQASLARVFDLIEIRPWSDLEARQFFENTFQTVNMTVDAGAAETMVRYSGGLPVLAHEIGDAVYKVAGGEKVTRGMAVSGIVDASEIVGRKYLEPQVFQAIKSPKYRSILKHVGADHFPFEFRRAELLQRLHGDERGALDNFLHRMTELGVIVRDPAKGQGSYRFSNSLHYLYIYFSVGAYEREK